MMVERRFPGGHFPKCIVLQAIFCYLRYSLSYRDIEELIKERGIDFLLTKRRDTKVVKRFQAKAASNNGIPSKIFYSLAA